MKQYIPSTDFDNFALHRATEDGDLARLKELIERNPERGERRDVWGLTPLHTAIMACNIDCFLTLLSWKQTTLEATLQGSPLPHVILSVASISGNAEFGRRALQALLETKSFSLLTQSKDDFERTPLRLACELALETELIRILLQAFDGLPDDDARRQTLTSADKLKKWNALHAAADVRHPQRREAIMRELFQHGHFADVVNYFDAYSRTGLHVLVRNTGVYEDSDPCCALLLSAGINAKLKDVLGKEAADYVRGKARPRRGPTFIFSHEVCSKHYTAPPENTRKAWYSKKDIPPENVNRLLVLLHQRFGTLHSGRILSNATHETNPPKCEMGDIVRIHEWGYVKHFQDKCDELEDDDELGELDGDTTYSKNTFDASLRACGSVIEAIDRIVSGKSENAFCAVRPPGHHAGPSGICPGCTSHGFCFLNTVAVAAAYSMDRHRDKIKRIAIVGTFHNPTHTPVALSVRFWIELTA